jgi:hypothetical protein
MTEYSPEVLLNAILRLIESRPHLEDALTSSAYVDLEAFLKYYNMHNKKPFKAMLELAREYNEKRTIVRFSEIPRIFAPSMKEEIEVRKKEEEKIKKEVLG